MKQILHIFVKDVRRFWPEISLSVAITAAFARYYPYQWTGADHMHAVMGNHLLVPYTAQFLGGRCAQHEPDAVIQEPCALLRDAQSAADFVEIEMA